VRSSDLTTLSHGIALFNRGDYFEAHEAWEEIWTPEQGPRRLFLQALIHLAVSFHHQRCANPSGAERQLRKGLKKLAAYLPEWEGINTSALYNDCLPWLDPKPPSAPPPQVRYNRD
jgi:predicted metal-dependent hydrolase